MKQLKFLVITVSLLLLSSCGSTGNVATSKAPKYNPNFDYTPPERANPRSANITVALINPVFADEDPNKLVPPYSTFIENMADDFEEMLIAKGFSLRGPFKSRDEMVYGDKKNSDIALEIRISLKEEGKLQMSQKTNWGQVLNKNASNHYTVGGTFYHFGNIIIEATDPFTGEKFWKKTVSLPRKEIVAQGNQTWTGKPTPTQMLSLDTGIYNPIAKALEEYYQEAIKTAWRHIDAQEMQMIKKEIEKSKN
jgi:hypothetical protein